MLNISVLNVSTPTGRSLPAPTRLGGMRPSPEKNTAISIVTPVLQPVFSLRLRPVGGGGRALFAKP
jgi:hypothetical protein